MGHKESDMTKATEHTHKAHTDTGSWQGGREGEGDRDLWRSRINRIAVTNIHGIIQIPVLLHRPILIAMAFTGTL